VATSSLRFTGIWMHEEMSNLPRMQQKVCVVFLIMFGGSDFYLVFCSGSDYLSGFNNILLLKNRQSTIPIHAQGDPKNR